MELPILEKEEKIVDALRANKVVIVVGETGSGKTTQLPQILYRSGLAGEGQIGVTEPRRIAAISVAKFVAEEMGEKIGGLVGYQVRFDDETAEGTRIKFMTDGILLRELQLDPDIRKYSVIMVDEAHERSQNIDFVLGLLKDVLKRRDDLRVIVASATIDHEKFSRYFWDAPVIDVDGRMFPVGILWRETDPLPFQGNGFVKAVADTVSDIHQQMGAGDVMVFMPGEDTIRALIDELEGRKLSRLMILPVYGAMAPEDQQKIFWSYPGFRKVIVGTNIMETSITVDGVVYVVDPGLVKQMTFNPYAGVQSLDVVFHSRAGCDQRAGRAGRTQPGICYRMYSKENYEGREQFTEPEICRTPLASVVLAMEDIGIENIEGFDFVDPPDQRAFHEAYQTLIALGAIERGKKGLTDIGAAMARLPLEPRIARMVLEAEKHGCVGEVTTIAAFLSVRNIFSRPRGKEDEADRKHRLFKVFDSDMLTFLKVWKGYADSNFSNRWCEENFLNSKVLSEVRKIREQIERILERDGIGVSQKEAPIDMVLKSVAAGLIFNLFRHEGRHFYSGVVTGGRWAYIHPGSAVFGSNPMWFVATEIVNTSKTYARGCSVVRPEWLPELLPNLFSAGEPEIIFLSSDRTQATVSQDLIFKGIGCGRFNRLISVPEARAIQDKKIRSAEARGWIRLTFAEEERGGMFSYSPVLVARGPRGERYRAISHWNVKTGAHYYCEVLPSGNFGIGDSAIAVYTKFEVLDLGGFPPQKSEEVGPEAPEEKGGSPQSNRALLSELAEKWGAKLK